MLLLDLWGISFRTVVVFALGKNLLFKFALGHCVNQTERLVGHYLRGALSFLCQKSIELSIRI